MDWRAYAKTKIDRSSWKPGPWDTEPDYFEWTTKEGYEVYAGRLNDTGTWFGVVLPVESNMMLAFCDSLKLRRGKEFDHQFGMISKTDQEGISGFVFSMEHWEGPGISNRDWFRGPYKTLKDLKTICDDVAQDIFDLHLNGKYVEFFSPIESDNVVVSKVKQQGIMSRGYNWIKGLFK